MRLLKVFAALLPLFAVTQLALAMGPGTGPYSNGGGGASPAGSTGQIQTNGGSGALGALSGTGIVSLSTGTPTVGTAPASDITGLAAVATSGSAADLTTGNLSVSRFNGGTGASSSTFWRGDGTWAAAGGGSSLPAGFTGQPYRRVLVTQPNQLGSTAAISYGMTNMVAANTSSNASVVAGTFCLQGTTNSTTNSVASWTSGASNRETEFQLKPTFNARFAVSTVSNIRIWVGLVAGDLSGVSTPTQQCAAIRFDTGAGDTHFQLVTYDGTTATVTDTGVTPAANTIYDAFVDGSAGSGSIGCSINGSATVTSTTHLPAATTLLGPELAITTLNGAPDTLDLGRVYVESQ